ncbi:glucose 1-dehydrogenase [Chitinophaga sp. Hz27]|uniref:glucose 1-dehydrogenase n=1 Tax=Chitinophaga sp. Hz27 TaxID=3347169 RepID=UPI0035D87AF5
MKAFNNKVVLITGGSTGIGLATALAFAERGAKLMIAGRNVVRGRAAIHLIQQRTSSATFIPTDVTQEEDVKHLITQTISLYGQLDIAINNAGVDQDPGDSSTQTQEDYHRIMDTNVKGTWLCLKHQLPALLQTKGCIVNATSIAGMVGFPGAAIYAASKHAIIGLTKSLALEYAAVGVRVNAVAPGTTYTPMYERIADTPEVADIIRDMFPMKRIAQPEEIANAIVFLCSKDAGFITGHTLVADGGYTAG